MTTILAIDPGNEGALAFLGEEDVILEPMPQTAEGKVDHIELHRLLAHYGPQATAVGIEDPYIPKGQNLARQHRHIGKIEGLLLALYVPYRMVRASDWNKAYPHGVTIPRDGTKRRQTAIKVARRQIAARLYPGIDLRKNAQSTVPHEGIVDALLMADYMMKGLRLGLPR